MLDGSAVDVGDPRGGAEVVGMVEVERGDRVRVVGQRVEVAEQRRWGGERVRVEGLRSVLELHGSQRVSRHAGIHHGKAVLAQLGGDTFTLGIIVLGVALRGDHQIGRHIQGGVVQGVVVGLHPVEAARGLVVQQLVCAVAAGIILVEARIVAVGEARETVLLVPAHLPGAAFLEKVVDGRIACGSVAMIIWLMLLLHNAAN